MQRQSDSLMNAVFSYLFLSRTFEPRQDSLNFMLFFSGVSDKNINRQKHDVLLII